MEKKKVLVLFGGPRKKASLRYLVDTFLEEKQYEGEFIFINDLNFRGCQSCFYCRTHERCVLKDDLTPIYDKIEKADKVILATPVFYGTIGGQLKCAMDRLFAFADIHLNKEGQNSYGSKLKKKRDLFVIASHGNSIPDVLECLVRPFRYLAVEINGVYKGMYTSPKLDFISVYDNEDVKKELLEKGKDF